MDLINDIYKIERQNLPIDEKRAYTHFMGNTLSYITLGISMLPKNTLKKYKKELKKIVSEIYFVYLTDKEFRSTLTNLAKTTNYGSASKYLDKLPYKYYRYFSKIEQINEEIKGLLSNLLIKHS